MTCRHKNKIVIPNFHEKLTFSRHIKGLGYRYARHFISGTVPYISKRTQQAQAIYSQAVHTKYIFSIQTCTEGWCSLAACVTTDWQHSASISEHSILHISCSTRYIKMKLKLLSTTTVPQGWVCKKSHSLVVIGGRLRASNHTIIPYGCLSWLLPQLGSLNGSSGK